MRSRRPGPRNAKCASYATIKSESGRLARYNSPVSDFEDDDSDSAPLIRMMLSLLTAIDTECSGQFDHAGAARLFHSVADLKNNGRGNYRPRRISREPGEE